MWHVDACKSDKGWILAKRDILWTLEVILIQFAAFLFDIGFVSVNRWLQSRDYKGEQNFRLRAWRLKFVYGSSVNLSVNRKGFRGTAHACQVSIKLSRNNLEVRGIDVCYFRPAAVSKIVSIIELTQSNQPSSHLSDFTLIELIILPTTHTHARWLRNSIMCEKNKPEISFR